MYLKQADRLRLQMQARHALPAPERADGDVALPQGTHHAMIFLAYAYRGLSETRQVADPRGWRLQSLPGCDNLLHCFGFDQRAKEGHTLASRGVK